MPRRQTKLRPIDGGKMHGPVGPDHGGMADSDYVGRGHRWAVDHFQMLVEDARQDPEGFVRRIIEHEIWVANEWDNVLTWLETEHGIDEDQVVAFGIDSKATPGFLLDCNLKGYDAEDREALARFSPELIRSWCMGNRGGHDG